MPLSKRDRNLAHTAGQNVSNLEDRNFSLESLSSTQLAALRGPLPVIQSGNFTPLATKVWWSYIGYTEKNVSVSYVSAVCRTKAVGTVTSRFALASTQAPPDYSNPLSAALTVLAVKPAAIGGFTADQDTPYADMLGFAVKPCVHLWAGLWVSAVTTQPQLLPVGFDLYAGYIKSSTYDPLTLVAGQVITATAPALITDIGPYLSIDLKY